jgi:hypothetical protein
MLFHLSNNMELITIPLWALIGGFAFLAGLLAMLRSTNVQLRLLYKLYERLWDLGQELKQVAQIKETTAGCSRHHCKFRPDAHEGACVCHCGAVI